MKPIYVFGYGTLQHRIGKGGETFCDPAFIGAQFMGDGILRGHMVARLKVYGRTWAAVVRQAGHVLGEVWKIDAGTLHDLDRREMFYPDSPAERSVYRRDEKPVVLRGSGEIVTAYVYTTDHNPQTDYGRLTHTWPVAGDPPQFVGMIRTHTPLIETPELAAIRERRVNALWEAERCLQEEARLFATVNGHE